MFKHLFILNYKVNQLFSCGSHTKTRIGVKMEPLHDFVFEALYASLLKKIPVICVHNIMQRILAFCLACVFHIYCLLLCALWKTYPQLGELKFTTPCQVCSRLSLVGLKNNALHHSALQGAWVKHLVLQALEPAVYLGRRRSTSFLQVSGVYIGFKCHKTLQWQALWDVIKHKYDWSAMEQWWHCLWDGLWLCQELAAKSIDPDSIAVCTTNTQGFMDLSHLDAADNLSILIHSYLKWTVYLFAPSHCLIWVWIQFGHFATSSWLPPTHTYTFSSWIPHLLNWKKTVKVCWRCSGIHPWPRFISCPGAVWALFK